MASPSSGRLAITPSSRVLQSPLSDESIWKRLKEAGLDEVSIKRRDKAALIAYIAKLETEIFEHQHHMGLLILEKKELASKYEQIKASAEAAELLQKHDRASHLSAIAEARKREESLKKTLGVEKECIASLEKAVHEIRAESAETKVAADSKFAEARCMVENAQKKFAEAEAKLHAAESLQAEANRYHRSAERKLQEVVAREDDLSRRIASFKADCEEKEREIIRERQSLSDRKKILQQEHERLLDAQTLLNEREDHILSKLQELSRKEKELEASRANVEEKFKALNEEKSNLDLTLVSLLKREEAVIEREASLQKKEQKLLVSQETLASKESNEIQKIIANHESALRVKQSEFEAELAIKYKLAEDEIEKKRRAWELRDLDLSQREESLLEREHDLEVQSRALVDKEKDLVERSHLLEEKENKLIAFEKEADLKKSLLQKEKEEVNIIKSDLQKSLSSLDEKKKQVNCAKDKLEAMKSEAGELSVLEIKLKEELDVVRAQKLELMVETDKLQLEKAKFEAEWEMIDEKREELRKEAERVAVERVVVSKSLKDERDSLRQERDAMRDQHKRDVDSLNREREEFMNKMVHEHSEWFTKIQQERADFLLGIEMQKRDLENCIEKRREELESSFREREKAFEEEKMREFQQISSLKEKAEKELEQVTLEIKRLDLERMEINMDRQRRDREWAELNNSIEELMVQRQKLEEQRQLLHADREEIQAESERLKKLEDLKIAVDYMAVSEMQRSRLEHSQKKISAKRHLNQQTSLAHADFGSDQKFDVTNNGDRFNTPVQKTASASPPSLARFSWIKRFADLVFKHSGENSVENDEEKSPTSDHEDASLTINSRKRQPVRYSFGEPKVILEVPSENEVVKRTVDLESENNQNAAQKCKQSVSEDGIHAARKRRVDVDCVDPSELLMQNNKRRKQQEDFPRDSSEEAINHGAVAEQSNLPEDQHTLTSKNKSNVPEGLHTLTSNNHTQGGNEEASILIVDKIIKISEVTCEMTDADNFINQEKIDGSQNSVAESVQDIVKVGGTNDHSTPAHTDDVVLPYISEIDGMVQEKQMGNVKDLTECGQAQNEMGEHKLECELVQSDNSKKNKELIAYRTRSKQKK
ncbi:protein CROWDED NUCLEI 4 [Citrus sinensis]|uniref:Protein CROWDED NUCLEI 4 n=1 Tax=Citrus sinensis TaxID=2711 RepID=A0ACB8J4E3_CITSI|nr:protein CROWDED NUCLEI 4 [Citrus sinensis]